MFCGKWNASVDEKWRLNIPAAIGRGIENFVLIKKDKDGCIRIEKPPLSIAGVDQASIYIMEVKVGRSNGKRFLIPQSLRGSTSFYYGRKVTLVGKWDYLEVWPRP